MAYLALFVALSGSAYAGITITGRDVRDSSLTGADVRNGTLTGADIRDGSIRTVDVHESLRPRRAREARFFEQQGLTLPSSSGQTSHDMATLSVAASRYVITSKIVITAATASSGGSVRCELRAGDRTDVASHEIGTGSGQARQATIVNQLAHTFRSPGRATLNCVGPPTGGAVANHGSLVANPG